MKRSYPVSVGLMIIVVLISACKPADVPRAAAPSSHTWAAQPVLIELFTSAGYTSPDFAWSVMPKLVIYADGRVVTTQIDYRGAQDKRTVLEAQLTTDEVCGLLTQIEADGFFDVSQADYREPGITDNGTTTIEVNAWRTQAIHAYALYYAVYEANAGAKVPPALATTYKRLSTYQPANGQPYQPERIAVTISSYEDTTTAAPLWPLAQPLLSDLLNRAGKSGEILLEGQEARDLYTLWNGDLLRTYTENSQTYRVVLRPLLPLEQYPRGTGWSPKPMYATKPQPTLTCSSDTVKAETPVPMTATPTATPVLSAKLPEAPLKHLTEFGRRDSPGQLDFPAGLAILPQDELLVGDARNHRFQIFSVDGKYLRELPLPDPKMWIAEFQRMPDGTLYVLDFYDVLYVMSANGHISATFTGWPKEKDDFSTHLAVGPDRTIYLAETRGKRVVILNADGTLREVWNGPADKPFSDIMSLATDTQGNLYVASDDQNRIVKRAPHGEIQEMQIKAPRTVLPLPDESFYLLSGGDLTYRDTTGKIIKESAIEGAWFPSYLAQATDGSVFVLDDDSLNKSKVIRRYSPSGNLLDQFGSTADEPGQFGSHLDFAPSVQGDIWLMEADSGLGDQRTPTRLIHLSASDEHLNTFETLDNQPFTCNRYALAAGPEQSVFLADPCSSTIRQVDPAGKILRQWGEKGTGPGQFNLIRSLALTPDGQSLLVVDDGNRRILQFGLDGALQHEWQAADLALQQPVDVAFDPSGNFYLLDAATQQVIVRTVTGQVHSWSLPDQNTGVNSIAIDPVRGRIYVGSSDIDLYVYSQAGNLLGKTSISGSRGVIVKLDPAGRVYASTGYDRIALLEPMP